MENVKTFGFARLDITPPLGINVSGYPDVRIADGVLDPLYMNAMAFGEGDKKAVLICCDTLGVYGPLAYEWPKMIAEHCGIEENSVFICHTHTHTGPLVSHWKDKCNPLYQDFFTKRLLDIATLAINDLKPVKDILAVEGKIPNLAFVRRHKMKDGTYKTWGKNGDPDIECMEVEPDDTMRIIRIVREGSPEIAISNFQSHPDCIGGCKYSADFPGKLREIIEKEKENTLCVFLNGAEGNMTRCDYIHGFPPKSYEAAMKYGEDIANAALKFYDDAVSVSSKAGLSFGKYITTAKTKRDSSRIPRAMEIRKLYAEGRWEEYAPNKGEAIAIVSEENQIIALEEMKKDFIDLNITAIGFGPLAFLGIPGEPFCETGEAIRKASPYEFTCVCCHTNGAEGYYPTAETFDHGGYEPRSTRLKKGAAEQVLETSVKLLNDIHE